LLELNHASFPDEWQYRLLFSLSFRVDDQLKRIAWCFLDARAGYVIITGRRSGQ
jgi:hypothetical protein